MGNNSVLEMKSISKRFGGVVALKDADLEVMVGEIHAIVGENGAGKSTLMNILNGSIRQDRGNIFLRGSKVDIRTPMMAQKLGISMVHQEFKLFPDLTVAENIFFGRQSDAFLIKWSDIFSKADKILETLGANIKSDTKVKHLSVALMQQVEIAKSLSQQCDLLILDEPTASLAPEEVGSLFKILKRLTGDNISIIYISHRIEEVFNISDKITVLRDGNKIKTLNTRETDKDTVIRLILGTEELFSIDKKVQKLDDRKKVLKVENLSINKKLSNISFSLSKGEVLGVAGLMGSGRTELLQSLFGNYPIKNGQIYVGGKKYIPKTPETAVKRKFALVPEDRKKQGSILGMSVKDNIVYVEFRKFAKFIFLNLSKEREETNKMLKKLNIKVDSMFQKVSSLSGGNQQKVIVAKWMMANSDIILLDEPTRGIDIGAKEEVFNIVQDLVSKGKSIIFVSSELEEVSRISNRILVLYGGKIVKELPGGTDIKTITKYVTGGKLYE